MQWKGPYKVIWILPNLISLKTLKIQGCEIFKVNFESLSKDRGILNDILLDDDH